MCSLARHISLILLLLPIVGSAQTLAVTMYPLPTPGSKPAGIVAGPDGALWFTETGVNKIGRISTAGVISEYPLPTPGFPISIAAGPDGALWFTGASGANYVYRNIIGRITTAGVITEFPVTIPDFGGNLSAIAAGPDGAMWFSTVNVIDETNVTGRITTDGVVTIYPDFSGNSMAAGPDGALWFTGYTTIGRLDMAGVLTGYPLPTSPAYNLPYAVGIASGPDGALWFTEVDASQIGRITTAGVVTEYPTPTAGSGPGTIATGPDGALWFTEMNQVGRITTAGVITEYPLPASAFGSQGWAWIAAGADGAMWFTAYSGNSIGRAVFSPAPAVVGATPSSGSGPGGIFTFQFSHPAGYQNLAVVNVLINGSLDARNACYLAYVPSTSTLYLVDDAGDAGGPFVGQVVLGSTATIRNRQCAVNLSSAVGNGTTLSLSLTISFQLFEGNKIVFAAARDLGADNTGWQATGVWQVPGTYQSLTVTGLTPARGTGSPGVAQLQLTLADTNGTGDLGIANLLINGNFVDGRSACYLAYVPATNTLFLVDDAGDAGGPYAGAMVLNGQPATIQNSQCLVSNTGTSVAYPPDTMMLTLSITFKAAFAGNRVVYAAGRSAAGANNTGWQPVGTWTVQ